MKEHYDPGRGRRIVDRMLAHDAFSRWLGIELLELREGYCSCRMTVREEMTNGFGIAHGGITFSLADSVFAFASNAPGRKAVSVHTSIEHLRPVSPGQQLLAEATEEQRGNRLGHYRVQVSDAESGKKVALFKGVVFRGEPWEEK